MSGERTSEQILPQGKEREGRSPVFLGMIFFLVSEVFLFGSLFWTYYYLRVKSSDWPPAGVALDSTLAEVHASLGFIALFYEWDWPAAAREFERSLALNPSHPEAHLFHGWYFLATGRPDEAVTEVRAAVRLDPFWPVANMRLMIYVPDCDAAFQRAIEAGAKPMFPPADMFWGDRCAGIADPFGYVWSFATRVKELTPEEMRKENGGTRGCDDLWRPRRCDFASCT